jgi:hypothetical protein
MFILLICEFWCWGLAPLVELLMHAPVARRLAPLERRRHSRTPTCFVRRFTGKVELHRIGPYSLCHKTYTGRRPSPQALYLPTVNCTPDEL